MRHPTVESELAANAKALRSLARDLVGRGDADDLVQETALRALGHPPEQLQNLGAWFATILRRLAGNHRRDDRRRTARHAALPTPDPGPPADDTVAQRESLNAVTQSLLALAEPYRTTLFRRYFEGLSPAAIASAANVPLATVKSRLQRGLAMLRESLDAGRQRDRWRTALLPAIGLTPFAVPLTTTLLLMSKTLKLSATAAVLIAALALCWPRDAADPVLPGERPVESGPVATASLADPSPVPREVVDREAAPATFAVDAPKLDLAHPFAFTLRCRVIDRDGLPVEGASVLFAPRGTSLNSWPTATDAGGCVDLAWRGRTESVTIAIGVANDRLMPGIQEVDLRAGTNRLVLLGEPSAPVRVSYTLGRKVKLEEPGCQMPGVGKQECSTCHKIAGFRGITGSGLQTRAGLHPDARFGDLLLPLVEAAVSKEAAVRKAKVRFLAANAKLTEMQARDAKVYAEVLTQKVERKRASAEGMGVVTGIVYGEDGKPVSGVTVVWCKSEDRPQARVRSGKDGTFRLEHIPVGNIVVRAGGGEQGIGSAMTATGPGAEVRCDVYLRSGACLRGRAIGRDGALQGWRIDYLAADGSWVDGTTVRDDGTFRFANLPGPGRLWLFAADGGLPVAIEPLAHPDMAELVFDLRTRGEPGGGLRLRPVPPKGLETRAEVRVWQADSRCAMGMSREKSGAFAIAGLAAGFYRIEIGAESIGWMELPPVWVDGTSTIDLGSVALHPPGELVLPNLPKFDALELYHRRPTGDVRAETGLGDRVGVALPVGDWFVFWKIGERIDACGFTIEAGKVTNLAIGGR